MKHDYNHLDNDEAGQLALRISMRELAELVVDLNRGTHRLLSHIVDVRRERLAQRVAVYRERGDHDVAAYAEGRGDELAAGIERLLESL